MTPHSTVPIAYCSGSTPSDSPAEDAMSTARQLPSFDDLPPYKNFPGCAWEVWGKDVQLGTINLLTPDVVKEAAQEIKCVSSLRSCQTKANDSR